MQRKFQEVGRLRDALPIRKEIGAADRHKPFRTERNSVETYPMPIAMPDRKVHMLGDEVDLLGRCGDPEIDLWVGCSKAPKPVHEPFGAEVRRGADGQYARRAVL